MSKLVHDFKYLVMDEGKGDIEILAKCNLLPP